MGVFRQSKSKENRGTARLRDSSVRALANSPTSSLTQHYGVYIRAYCWAWINRSRQRKRCDHEPAKRHHALCIRRQDARPASGAQPSSAPERRAKASFLRYALTTLIRRCIKSRRLKAKGFAQRAQLRRGHHAGASLVLRGDCRAA